MDKAKIMVVEDEPKIAGILKDYLEDAGFAATLVSHGNGVMAQLKKTPPDLVILDIMLPGRDGLDICREVRKTSLVPIIMLTARVEEIDRLLGLELGADDYICKPFSPREVVARVRAVLRRSRPQPAKDELNTGPIVLDRLKHRLTINEDDLSLTQIEFELMRVFMEQPDRVFSRNDLIAQVQGYDFEGYDRTIDSHIKNLRKKISRHLPDRKIIHTVYGVGYKFSLRNAPDF